MMIAIQSPLSPSQKKGKKLSRLGSTPVQSFLLLTGNSDNFLAELHSDCREKSRTRLERLKATKESILQQTSEKRAASMVRAMRNSSSRAAYCFLPSASFSCSSASLWACRCSRDATSLAIASRKSAPPGCNRTSSCFLSRRKQRRRAH